jgi:DNA-binding MarR family transcriptional regulator
MTLNYLYIPVGIMKLPDLNLREKLLLALVVSFNNKGLRAGNKELSVLLDVWPSRVSRLLKSLEQKGYVKIENPQSRYRVVHLLQSAQVEDILLAIKRNSRSDALATLSTPTVAQSSNIIEEVKDAAAHKCTLPVCERPPTEKQVRDYSITQGSPNFDAERFVEWYTAAGWRHKDGEPMLNWKQTVLNWLRRDRAREAAKPEPKRG